MIRCGALVLTILPYAALLGRRTAWTILTLALAACRSWEPTLHPAEAAPPAGASRAPLKAHLHSGDLIVFTLWQTPADGE